MRGYCLSIGLFLGLLAQAFQPQFFQALAAAENVEAVGPNDVPLVAEPIRQAMQDGDFAAARKAIDEGLKAKGAASDYLAYLRAWSYHLDKQDDASIAAFIKFEKEFPQSRWLRRARFGMAQAMVAKKDFLGAEAIYEQEAKTLLSDAHRAQAASIYREYADAQFQPPRKNQPPDYAKALAFYTKATVAGLPADRRAEVALRIGRCFQMLAKPVDAAKAYESFLTNNRDDGRTIEVRYRLGESLLAAGKLVEARQVWRELIAMRKAATTGPAPEAGGERFAEAAFHLAETWHVPEPQSNEQLRHGVAALEAFIEHFPAHALVGQAHLNIASSQIQGEHFDEAIAALDRFIKDPRWKDCKEQPEARGLLGNAYKLQKKYNEELTVWREYLVRYPTDAHWGSIQQAIVDAEYEMAIERFKAGDDKAATKLLGEFVAHYPLDARNPGILYLFGQMHYRQKQWEAAIAEWQRLAAKHPQTEEASHATFTIARTLEEKLGRYEDAGQHYRKVTGQDIQAATIAEATMIGKSMTVTTERTFRSNETPLLKVVSRNVPEVKVRIYKIDLETYFRKMHSIAGIDRLDVSLIDPDATLDFKIPDYAKYKSVQSSVATPLPESATTGVATVTVSSPEMEATTLIVQSDLDILVKSSRDEVLVFAENGRTGKAWPGVRLLISDGRTIVAEAMTGEDGSFRHRYPELKDASHVRVFATAGSHVASAAVCVLGAAIAGTLADKVFLETDRPNYAAGQTVHVRGCARHADGERFTIEPGKKYVVEAIDGNNRRLRRQDVVLSPIGTFHFDLPLPHNAADGNYRIVVLNADKSLCEIAFEVRCPPRNTDLLILELPKRTYCQGETIDGTLRALLPNDAPLVGAKVQYSFDGRSSGAAITDAHGEAHISLPTDDLEQSGKFMLAAAIEGRSVKLECAIDVIDQALFLGLDTGRAIRLAGEAFDVRVKANDLTGRRIAEKVRLKVLKKKSSEDDIGDQIVEEHILSTLADGSVRQTLKIAKGGVYTIQVAATDRFGNLVTTDREVTISGDDDPQPLLLLVDRTDLDAGDTADINVHWRGAPALAMITCNTDRIVEQHQVILQPGTNRVRLPIGAAMAPGFILTASVMSDLGGRDGDRAKPLPSHRLYEALCGFTVNSAIRVKIDCQRSKDNPASATATVTTLDAQGKPVSAEVCLTARPSTQGEVGNATHLTRYFQTVHAIAQFHAASSIQFQYQPVTRLLPARAMVAGNGTTVPSHIASQAGLPQGVAARTGGGSQFSDLIHWIDGADRPINEARDNDRTDENEGLQLASPSAVFDAPDPEDEGPVVATSENFHESPSNRQATIAHAPPAEVDPFGGGQTQPTVPTPASNAQISAAPKVIAFAHALSRGEWHPSVTTGADGRATVVLSLDSSADFVLQANAITQQSLTGESVKKLRGTGRHVLPNLGKSENRPVGLPREVRLAGVASGNTTVVLPGPLPPAATLQIHVDPTVESSLFEMVNGDAGDYGNEIDRLATPDLHAASDLLAAVSQLKIYPSEMPKGRTLDDRIRTLMGFLLVDQRDDGSWGSGDRGPIVATTALAYWSLVVVQNAGYQLPGNVLKNAQTFLHGSIGGTQPSDLETKAIVAHVLAVAGQGDFALVNQLLRDRASLMPTARAYLALALAEMDRKDAAADLLKSTPLASRDEYVEAHAIAALGWLTIDSASPQGKAAVEWLLNHRAGLRWTPERATGSAAVASMRWLAANRNPVETCRVEIVVNGHSVAKLNIDPNGQGQSIAVPVEFLVKDFQQIVLRPSGSARLSYRCMLAGIEPIESLQVRKTGWNIRRTYEPGRIEAYGQAIDRGYDILIGNRHAEVANPMTQLPAARRGSVKLHYEFKGDGDDAAAAIENVSGAPLMIVEPLPGGVAVVEKSIRGDFDSCHILLDRLVFSIGSRNLASTISYELEGTLPGSYRIGPTILRRCEDAAPLAVASGATLVVLPQGGKSNDPYFYSPEELLSLGQLAAAKGDTDAALRYFTELLDKWHGKPHSGLNDSSYKTVVAALVDIYLQRGLSAKAVQYCEIMKENWPERPVTLDQLLKAAAAYRDIGETERSYGVCRAVIEGHLASDSGLAGFVEEQGDFLRGLSLMNRHLQNYPPEPYAAEAELELAQHVYAKASEAASNPVLQPELRRDALILRAWQKLEALLTANPNDPTADQTAFAAANALLDRKQYAAAGQAAAAYSRRYPQSDLKDSFWYVQGYCDFATGKHASAIDLCRKVADSRHLDKNTGKMVDSQNRSRAIYILGQIYQSLGQRGDAIREYRRIANQIPDAKASVAFFTGKRIALPECTTLKPNAAVEVELAFRNVSACDVKIFRVDLLKLCETGRASGNLGQVNLSGIRPLHEISVALGDGKDYRDRTHKLALPLKKEGAYLVVCRGENLYASGLVVVSPLELESHTDAETGLVQVFVKDATANKYVSEAQVRLLHYDGGQRPAMVTGTTDFRGVFTGNCPAEDATIVVRSADGRYAFAAGKSNGFRADAVAARGEAEEVDPTLPFRSRSSRSYTGSPVYTENLTETEDATTRIVAADSNVPPLSPDNPHASIWVGPGNGAAERKIREALASQTTIDFVDTPLTDVIDYIKDLHKIEIQLDAAGLKDAGQEPDVAITKKLKGISLRSALRLMLDNLQLTYVIHNEVLLITSRQNAESDKFMRARVYRVEDLVLPPGSSPGDQADFQPLQDLISQTVDAKSWLDNGGGGTMSPFPTNLSLVVSQTEEVHEQIEAMLEAIRRAGTINPSLLHRTGEASQSPTSPQRFPAAQGMGGGSMGGGGMGGGMGGGGGFGAVTQPPPAGTAHVRATPGQTPFVISVIPFSSRPGDVDLLEGVKGANQANQNEKIKNMKSRQKNGQQDGFGSGGSMGAGFF